MCINVPIVTIAALCFVLTMMVDCRSFPKHHQQAHNNSPSAASGFAARHRAIKRHPSTMELDDEQLLDDLEAGGSGRDQQHYYLEALRDLQQVLPESSRSSVLTTAVRRKRHNKHDAVAYKQMSDAEKKAFMHNRNQYHEANNVRSSGGGGGASSGGSGELTIGQGISDFYELEVKEAQNSSICNYTVEPIPDESGGTRVPRDLEHVKCNHVGTRCQNTGTYCCIQTYRMVMVKYGDDKEKPMKIYAGCVCSLQLLAALHPHHPRLPLND